MYITVLTFLFNMKHWLKWCAIFTHLPPIICSSNVNNDVKIVRLCGETCSMFPTELLQLGVIWIKNFFNEMLFALSSEYVNIIETQFFPIKAPKNLLG
jgi:hypothetical protein